MAEITLPTEIRLNIVTPDHLVAQDAVTAVTIPGKDGYLGILPGHAPLLTELGCGEMEYTSGNAKHILAVTGGFAEVLGDRVIVLVDSAERVPAPAELLRPPAKPLARSAPRPAEAAAGGPSIPRPKKAR